MGSIQWQPSRECQKKNRRGFAEANWPRIVAAHSQSVLQGGGLGLADRRRKASLPGTGGREAGTASQTPREVQS